MNQLSSKNRLKDKFSKLELSIEDEKFGIKLTEESVKKIQTNSYRKKKSNLPTTIFRFLKLSASFIKKISKYCYSNIIKKSLVFLQKILKKVFLVIKEKEENLEILLVDKVTLLENMKNEIEEVKNKKIKKVEFVVNEYYNNVQVLFLDLVEENVFEMPNTELNIIQSNLDFQMSLLEIFSKKLIASNMIMNAKSMKLETKLEKDELLSTICISMDKKGYAWAKMFGKYIVPELNRSLESRSGIVVINHVHNITKAQDYLLISVNFKITASLIVEKPIAIQKRIKTVNRENML